MDTIEKEKVIVTGGAGFIGSHIVDALILDGYEVHIVDDMSAGREENINQKATMHRVDIRDLGSLMPIFAGAKYVFHEAAIPQVEFSLKNPIETNEINVNGLLNVLEASRLNKVKRLVFASSSAIYGDVEALPINESIRVKPLSPYGAQKYIGEVYLKLYSRIYGLETVCLRYFNVYGPRQVAGGAYFSVIPRFINFKKMGEPLPVVGDGEQTRDFVNVRDVARANILAMKSEKVASGDSINIGSGKSCSVNHIARLVGGEVSFIEARIEPKDTLADVSKAKELLDWESVVSLEEGIEELVVLSGK